jgi:Uncharacterized bacitracin resistance protein
MIFFQAIIYGIVQGITEFLPVSSTAHLNLLPWIFGWESLGNTFDVALHFGTAIAVIVFFRKEWVSILSAGFTKPKTADGKLFWWIVIATIPGGIAGVALDKYMGNFSPLLTGVLLVVMGIILYACDKYSKNDVSLEKMGVGRSLIVGIAQVLAIVPGVSRSGITMAAGRACRVDRTSIAKFTFLISTPIILGDALFHAKDLSGMNIQVLPFMIAIATAAIVGMLTIRFLLNFLKTKSLLVFALYRFIFGAFVIALYLIR